MEKEFVLYKEALELKELGFDEPCFGTYLSSLQSDWKVYELILEMGMNEEFEDNRNVYLSEGACSAPTFSQAFRWFREKHNVFSSVNVNYCYKIYNNDELFKESNEHNNYEEAELACLKKLIELVKNK